MKRLIYILIPLLLMIFIVFGTIKVFTLYEGGKGALQVTSQPLGKVYLNDAYIGNTPLCRCESSTMLNDGDYTVKIIPLQSGLSEFQEAIHITKGVLTVIDRKFGVSGMSEGSTISLTPLNDKQTTELFILSLPDKADVSIDSVDDGQTPKLEKNLTNSDHTIRLRKIGYKDKIVRVRTPRGYRLTANISLALKTDTGSSLPQKTPTSTPAITISQPLARVLILPTPNGFLRVRQSPSLSAAEVTRVNSGDSFPLLAEQPEWFQIKLTDGSTGWINTQYAKKQ